MNAIVRSADVQDAARIVPIYNHYVAETCITFETEPVTEEDMARRIRETHDNALPWLVAEEGSRICGYAYASKWKGRCAYRFAVEATIYLDPECTGRGLGVGKDNPVVTDLHFDDIRNTIARAAFNL